MMNRKPIIYVDMDNVLCEYDKAHKQALIKTPKVLYPQSVFGFYLNLKPIPGAIEAYKKLKLDYDVCILTKPSVINAMSYTEKRYWIEIYLGYSECENLIISCDKTLLKGDILIDDNIQTGRKEPDWEHIHFGTKKFQNWTTVLNYLKNYKFKS